MKYFKDKADTPLVQESKKTSEKKAIKEAVKKEDMLMDILVEFLGWGYADIETAIKAANEAKISFEDVKELIDEFGYNKDLSGVDIVGMVYECIMQKAKAELSDFTSNYELEDALESFYVAANYMTTSFDYNSEDQDFLQTFLKDNKKKARDFSEATQYFLDGCDISL